MAESRIGLAHRVSLLVRRLRLQVEELFDHAWAVVPSQPVLNFFLFLATLAVIFIAPPISFEELGIGWWVFVAWCALSLAGPLGVYAARLLILRCRGRRRLFGFWIRLAADVMQWVALSAYLVARIFAEPFDDGLLYSQIAISGIWMLQLLWVVRDVWALILIERTATRLNAIVYGR